jgi:hypothetical protein
MPLLTLHYSKELVPVFGLETYIYDYIIRPYVLEDCFDGKHYSNFFEELLPCLLGDVPLYMGDSRWCKHNCAPPHFACQAQKSIDNNLLGIHIGHEGPIAWLPRSSNLTLPPGFLFVGMSE